MPRRKKVSTLPPDLRRELDRRLIEGAFSGYVDLAAWLDEQGHGIGKTALHNHGQELERRIERIRHSTEQAEALVAAAPDDSSAMADASLRLVQEQIYNMLYAAEGGNLKDAANAARAMAETVRAGLAIRQDRRKILDEAAAAAGTEAAKLGLSSDVTAAIRAAIEGGGRGSTPR